MARHSAVAVCVCVLRVCVLRVRHAARAQGREGMQWQCTSRVPIAGGTPVAGGTPAALAHSLCALACGTMRFALEGTAVPEAFAARCVTLLGAAQDAAADDVPVSIGGGIKLPTLQLLLLADAAAWGGDGAENADAEVAAVVRGALLHDEARSCNSRACAAPTTPLTACVRPHRCGTLTRWRR